MPAIRPFHKLNRRLTYWLFVSSLIGLACSETSKGDSIGSGPDQNDGKDAGKPDSGSPDDTIGGGPMNTGGVIHLDPQEVCKTISTTAEVIPLDVYVMLDQSLSMDQQTASGVTRWKAVTDAIASFVQDDRAAGIGVGIDYFGVGYDSEENCKAEYYADPDVEIADLPGNSAALLSSLQNALGPASSSKTPTFAALDGALQHAKQHAQELSAAGSNKLTAVVMASDGFPTECNQSLPDISQLAADALNGTPQVKTFFISLTEGEANAKEIAKKGGGRAFIITDQDDVKTKFIDAMLTVTTAPIRCTYNLAADDTNVGDAGAASDGGVAQLINADRAEVGYTSAATHETRFLPLLKDMTKCLNTEKDGFYLTPADHPTQLTLCNKSCSELGAGTLEIKVACIQSGGVH